MTQYNTELHKDSLEVKTPAEYNAVSERWEMPIKQADGGDETQGAKADTAVTDPTAEATVVALLKGLIKQLQGDGAGAADVQLTGSSIPDLESVPIHAVEAIETVGYFNSPVIMPDVSTELAGSTTGSPSISVDISNAKNIGVFADLKTAVADEDLVFEVSHDNSTWFAFETKNFATPSSRYNYFALASGGNILANYIRVTPKNNDGSAITLPYIILVIKG